MRAWFERLLCLTQRACIALMGAAAMAGCSRAPSFSILGSFFPAWLVCIVIGIVLAAAANRVLIYFKLDQEIVGSIVVYPCIAAFFACIVWLTFFS
jgi:hypothetical protein